MDAPYGVGIRESVVHDNVMWLRSVALCEIHHAVGDFFTIEHIYPSYVLELDRTKALLELPGVWLLTWDNCAYGGTYRRRQFLITNLPCLVQLSRDCPGVTVTRKHAMLSGSGIKTSLVSAFAWQLVEHWAALYSGFVKSPSARTVCTLCTLGRLG